MAAPRLGLGSLYRLAQKYARGEVRFFDLADELTRAGYGTEVANFRRLFRLAIDYNTSANFLRGRGAEHVPRTAEISETPIRYAQPFAYTFWVSGTNTITNLPETDHFIITSPSIVSIGEAIDELNQRMETDPDKYTLEVDDLEIVSVERSAGGF